MFSGYPEGQYPQPYICSERLLITVWKMRKALKPHHAAGYLLPLPEEVKKPAREGQIQWHKEGNPDSKWVDTHRCPAHSRKWFLRKEAAYVVLLSTYELGKILLKFAYRVQIIYGKALEFHTQLYAFLRMIIHILIGLRRFTKGCLLYTSPSPRD